MIALEELEHERTLYIQLEILGSLWDRLQDLFRRREWTQEEGLRMVLAAGLASLEADDRYQNPTDASLEGNVEGLVLELARLDSEYSAMKYRAFKLAEANRALQIKLAGLKASEQAWQRWANMMRQEMERLKQG